MFKEARSPPVARLPPLAVVLLAVVLLWGVNWPIMKIELDFIPPLCFAALRMPLVNLPERHHTP